MISLVFTMACCRTRISFTYLREAMQYSKDSYYELDDIAGDRDFRMSEGLRSHYTDIGATVIQSAINWDAPLYNPKGEIVDSIVRGYSCSNKARHNSLRPAKRKYNKRYYDDLEDAAWEKELYPKKHNNNLSSPYSHILVDDYFMCGETVKAALPGVKEEDLAQHPALQEKISCPRCRKYIPDIII